MRILLSTGIFPNRNEPTRGIYILRQAVALKRFAEVTAVAPVPYIPRWFARGGRRGLATLPRQDTIEGVHVSYPRYVVVPRLMRWMHGVFLFVSVWRHYRRVLGQARPDVVLAFFAFPYGFATVLIAKLHRLPVIVGTLGSDINQMARGGLRSAMIGWALRGCDRVISVSTPLRERTLDLGAAPEKSKVIPNGVERNIFHPRNQDAARRELGLPERGTLVVTVSRLSPEKGLDVLIDAASKLRRSDVVVYVVGDGISRPELREQIVRLRLEDRVFLIGDRPHSEIPLWMAAGDLFVLPSRMEGHPNALLEALSCGRPAVASRVGGVPDVMVSDEVGVMVPPDDSRAMADAIESVLQRRWDAQRIVDLAGSRTWDDVAEEIVREIESVTAPRNACPEAPITHG